MSQQTISSMRSGTPQGQKGVSLITGLIFLVLLTLLGVTTMQSNTMQERMAGNQRDRNLAFQSAETALRDAEAYLLAHSLSEFTAVCTSGLCTTGNAPDWKTDATWASTSTQVVTYGTSPSPTPTTISGVSSQPKYFAEYIGNVPCSTCSTGFAEGYRIVAHGVGANANTIVNLEEIYSHD